MKINWRKNLVIAWIGCFFTGASISLVMPFIPVYVEQLGTPKDQIELFSGLAISVTAFASAVVAPIWGNLADRKGRKLMMFFSFCAERVLAFDHAFLERDFVWVYSKCNSNDCFTSA